MITTKERLDGEALVAALAVARKEDDKYIQIKPLVIGDYTIQRHEYVTPSGEAGYEDVVRIKKNNEEWIRISSHVGPERNRDRKVGFWKKINED